jgi:hypothetical protein
LQLNCVSTDECIRANIVTFGEIKNSSLHSKLDKIKMSKEREDKPEIIETIYLGDEKKVIEVSQISDEERKINWLGPTQNPNITGIFFP